MADFDFNSFAPESRRYVEMFLTPPDIEDTSGMTTRLALAKYLHFYGTILGKQVPQEVWDDESAPVGVIAIILQTRLKKDGFEFNGYQITKRPLEFAVV